MAYNKYKKLGQLVERLGISYQSYPFLPAISTIEVSAKLLGELEDALLIPLTTEKAKSEHIVVPVLKELLRNNVDKMSYFSGFQFDVDEEKDLNGYCDFILAAKSKIIEIEAPIFCLVEAKNDNVEKGLAQCGAEMYAAKCYNDQKKSNKDVIYGCVTNAFSWAFLQLKDNVLYIDPNYVPLTSKNPHLVVSVLQWVLGETLAK